MLFSVAHFTPILFRNLTYQYHLYIPLCSFIAFKSHYTTDLWRNLDSQYRIVKELLQRDAPVDEILIQLKPLTSIFAPSSLFHHCVRFEANINKRRLYENKRLRQLGNNGVLIIVAWMIVIEVLQKYAYRGK